MPRPVSWRSTRLPALLGAGGDDLLGSSTVGPVDGGIDRGDAEVLLDPLPHRLAELRADVGAQLLERVELGGLGGEVVAEVGQDLLAHLLDRDGEDGLPPGQVLRPVVLGEGDLDLALVAGAHAGELLLEALDQLAVPSSSR